MAANSIDKSSEVRLRRNEFIARAYTMPKDELDEAINRFLQKVEEHNINRGFHREYYDDRVSFTTLPRTMIGAAVAIVSKRVCSQVNYCACSRTGDVPGACC